MRRRCFIAAGAAWPYVGLSAASLEPKPRVFPLTPQLRGDIDVQASNARTLLSRYAGGLERSVPAQIDHAIAAWSIDRAPSKVSPAQVIEQCGAYLGEHFVRELDLEWQVYRDSQGTDLCVIHKTVFVFSFPHASVYRAVVQGKRSGLLEVENALRRQIAEAVNDPMIERRES